MDYKAIGLWLISTMFVCLRGSPIDYNHRRLCLEWPLGCWHLALGPTGNVVSLGVTRFSRGSDDCPERASKKTPESRLVVIPSTFEGHFAVDQNNPISFRCTRECCAVRRYSAYLLMPFWRHHVWDNFRYQNEKSCARTVTIFPNNKTSPMWITQRIPRLPHRIYLEWNEVRSR